jgi:hypothetical protein
MRYFIVASVIIGAAVAQTADDIIACAVSTPQKKPKVYHKP